MGARTSLAFPHATICANAQDQTFKVGDQPAPPTKPKPGAKAARPQSTEQPSEKGLGWGSNIQNARLARAAENALRNHNYAQAVDYAQRAADSAPGDAHLWFLLGYTARLAGKTQLAVDAYNHGLRVNSSSLEGISGLAQTYSACGRSQEDLGPADAW